MVVTLPAEIDIANAEQVGEQLSSAIARGAGIVIADMTGTRFCDSSGISMLVQAHRQAAANQAELRLVVLATAVLRALKLVRMDFLLPIYPSLDAALAPDAQPERELPAPVPVGARVAGLTHPSAASQTRDFPPPAEPPAAGT
jgi:anti-anti-sigma factor